jgi:two-component system CheB/CheR fusion protein
MGIMAKSKRAIPAQPKPAPAADGAAVPAPSFPARPERVPSPLVVGIGASAGGLEALRQLLEAMPADTGLAFVHIQHLDPVHKSMMAELLGGVTGMRVRNAEDGDRLEANCVYISPPDRDVAVVGDALRLTEPVNAVHTRMPIDFFFRSLALDRGDRAIGVVLSGTATDGTLGVRAIKAAGGLAVAQQPSSAKYDGMPRSAIATQLVDFVAPPQDIPRILQEYARHPYVATPEARGAGEGRIDPIFNLLREHTGHDFSRYKRNTIRRRIERRMAVHQLKHLDEYVRYLSAFPAEVEALFKDLLIGVTSFFRDPAAFEALEEIVPRLLRTTAESGSLRVWVPSCSTGEEPYSIAMMLAEQLEKHHQTRKVTVFATDIDGAAIDVARVGVYPESIAADVGVERLRKFFTREDGAYRIAKRVREQVVFATQDVLKDPPFSRLDLISCRNLLIYLESDVQRRLVHLFHAVLNPGGVLFLGGSETAGDAGELFAPLDRKWKVFEKRALPIVALPGALVAPRLDDVAGPAPRPPGLPAPPEPRGIAELTAHLLVESYAPACVVVDEHHEMLYFQGRTGRYLEMPQGLPQWNILKMARGEMLRELRGALHKAARDRVEVVRPDVPVHEGDAVRFVRLRVKPFRGPKATPHLLLIAFEDQPAPASNGLLAPTPERPADARVSELERQLASTKESLQSTLEEVETSNEELRSTNEELQSANEELQSTNEELETSREELQSVNEELLTVNNELQKKLEELSHANNDLTNLLNSTDIGTVFLDNDLCIKRFTPSVARLVNLIASDVGRPIGDIVTQVIDDTLVEQAREVLRSLVFRESEVNTRDGRTYLRRILPYRTVENMIDGVVVTFVNVTEAREAKRLVESTLLYANELMNAVRQPLVLISNKGRVVQVNDAYYTMFRTRREDTLGAHFLEMDGGRWGQPQLRAVLDGVTAGGPAVAGYILNQELPGLGRRTLRLYLHRTQFGTKAVAGEEELIVLIIEDATASSA